MFRRLLGDYRGGQYPDWLRLNACLLELAKDIPAFDSRITALESNSGTIFTNANFIANTISGNILQDNTISSSKLSGGITGDQLVSNSSNGITNKNIAADAAISISKIDISNLNHSQLAGIGTQTHAQLESSIATLASDYSNVSDGLVTTNALVASVNSFLGNRALSTTSTNVSGAINELKNSIANISTILPSGANFTGNQDQYHIMTAVGSNHSIQESALQATNAGMILPSQTLTPSAPTSGLEVWSDGTALKTIDSSGNVVDLSASLSLTTQDVTAGELAYFVSDNKLSTSPITTNTN